MTKNYHSIKNGRCCGSGCCGAGKGKDFRYEYDESDPTRNETVLVADVVAKYQLENRQGLSEREISILRDYLLRQDPDNMTVYRGQKTSKEIRRTAFFSCSKDWLEAKRFTGKDKCCLFTIHLVDAQLLDINRFMEAYLGLGSSFMEEEEEILVLGGGRFYKTADMTEEGFTKIRDSSDPRTYRSKDGKTYATNIDEYECWYKSIEANV